MEYKEREIIVCFVKLRDTLKNLFLKSGITDIVGKEMFFAKISKAIQWLDRPLEDGTSLPGSLLRRRTFSKLPTPIHNGPLTSDNDTGQNEVTGKDDSAWEEDFKAAPKDEEPKQPAPAIPGLPLVNGPSATPPPSPRDGPREHTTYL